jgi:uncharacterized repeat protein (TIGR02543 family)
MKKNNKRQFSGKTAICFLGAILFLLFSGCSGPFTGEAETGTLTINFGAGGRRAAAYPPSTATLKRISYEINLSGPSTKKVGPTAPGTQTVSISVAPGFWDITVTASLDGEKYAEGSSASSVEVKAGQTASVTVKMHSIGTPDLSGTITIAPNTGVVINTELTATYSGGETVSYQWKKGSTNVGTNSNKFTPTEPGQYTVTVSAAGYNSKTSYIVDVIDPSLPNLTGTITITTSKVSGNVLLTANYSGGETVTWQWNKDGIPTSGVSSTYTAVAAGSYNVTVSAAGYNSKTSDPVSIVTLTYDLNGGTGTTPAAHTDEEGTGVTLESGSGLIKAGYMFGGWNENSGGTGANHSASTTYTLSTSITLYAKWEDPVFNSISDFSAWLATQPANNAAAPYTVKLNLSSIGGTYATPNSLGNVLSGHSTKFVILDLSGSTLNDVPNTTEILYLAFANADTSPQGSCKNLVGITLPTGITNSGYDAFWNCTNLASVIMPGVTEIHMGCFTNCTSLTSVTIPVGVTIIRDSAFVGCSNLNTVIFAAGSNISNGIIPGSSSPYFSNSAFIGDLRSAYFGTNGGAGTYTRTGSTWTK